MKINDYYIKRLCCDPVNKWGHTNECKLKDIFTIKVGPYKGQRGMLIGEINFSGCPSGWHTLMVGKNQLLFAGSELIKEQCD